MEKLAKYLLPSSTYHAIKREVTDFDLKEVIEKINYTSSVIGKQFGDVRNYLFVLVNVGLCRKKCSIGSSKAIEIL